MGDDEPEDDGNSLVCPFLNADPAFAFGVEFGMLWERMRRGDADEIGQYFTTANEEQIRLAAGRLGWDIAEIKLTDEDPDDKGWVFMRLVKRDAAHAG